MSEVLNYSGRHTRLRYQAVLFSILFFLSVHLGVDKLTLPGVLTFDEKIGDTNAKLGVLVFAFYSIVSFWLQDKFEKQQHRSNKNTMSELLDDFDSSFNSASEAQTAVEKLLGLAELSIQNAGYTPRRDGVQYKKSMLYSLHADWKENFAHSFDELYSSELLLGDRKLDSSGLETYFKGSKIDSSFVVQRISVLEEEVRNIILDLQQLLDLQTGEEQQNLVERTRVRLRRVSDYSASGNDMVSQMRIELSRHHVSRLAHFQLLPFLIPIVFSLSVIVCGIILWVKGL